MFRKSHRINHWHAIDCTRERRSGGGFEEVYSEGILI